LINSFLSMLQEIGNAVSYPKIARSLESPYKYLLKTMTDCEIYIDQELYLW